MKLKYCSLLWNANIEKREVNFREGKIRVSSTLRVENKFDRRALQREVEFSSVTNIKFRSKLDLTTRRVQPKIKGNWKIKAGPLHFLDMPKYVLSKFGELQNVRHWIGRR